MFWLNVDNKTACVDRFLFILNHFKDIIPLYFVPIVSETSTVILTVVTLYGSVLLPL